jgi:amino acid transporter
VISLQIGSEIFTIPTQINHNVLTPGAGVSVWLLAGALVWTGAASFTELGLTITENGGIQEYLRHCYGEFMGCLFTWTWVIISKSASMAAITAVFANYICRALYRCNTAPRFVVYAVGLIGL